MDPNSQLIFLGSSGSSSPALDEWVLTTPGSYTNEVTVDASNGDIFVGGMFYNGANWLTKLYKFTTGGGQAARLKGSNTTNYAITAAVQDNSGNIYIFDRGGYQVRNKSTFAVTADYAVTNAAVSYYSGVFDSTNSRIVLSSYNNIWAHNTSGSLLWKRSNPSEYYYYSPVLIGSSVYIGMWNYATSVSYCAWANLDNAGQLGTVYRGASGYALQSMATDGTYFYITGYTTASPPEMFLIKVTPTGTVQWAKYSVSSGVIVSSTGSVGIGSTVAVDGTGNIYVGTTYGYLLKFNSTGTLQWIRGGFNSINTNYGNALRVQGNYVYCGSTAVIAKFKTTTTLPAGTYGGVTFLDVGSSISFTSFSPTFNTASLSNVADPTTSTVSTRTTDTYTDPGGLTLTSLV